MSSTSELEWLQTNALGSFALGCVDRKLRRKYHALLTVRDPGHGEPWNVLAETRELISSGSCSRAEPHTSTAGSTLLVDPLSATSADDAPFSFLRAPDATHVYRLPDPRVELERSVRLGVRDQVELHFRVHDLPRGDAPRSVSLAREPARFDLHIEPLLRCRPLHALTQENPFLDGTCIQLGDEVRMLPYAGMPAIALRVYGAQATFTEQGRWWAVHEYAWEAARGYPASESLFSPGRFTIALSTGAEFTFVLGLHRVEAPSAEREPELASGGAPEPIQVREREPEPLARAVGQFQAESTSHQHCLIAGYPWHAVRSRDALLALPGVYLASGDFRQVERVLSFLTDARVRGLVPKSPAFAGQKADTPSLEASLLFIYVVQWFAGELGEQRVAPFMPVVCELLESVAEGSDPRVRFERGVSVYCEPGPEPLTWMDACAHGRPLTPRAGHAVELDALAYNAVHFACAWADHHRPGFARTFRNRLRNAEGEFVRRYWDDALGYLADTHDGFLADVRLRPNQLWALALPYRPLSNAMARSVLQAVARDLWTPRGLRTLSPSDPSYRGRYEGDQAARDAAAHQGCVWPWLTGIYADALAHTLGHDALEAHLAPILASSEEHLEHEGCIGQMSELFDGDAPHRARGAPAYLTSAAELYRARRLLAESAQRSAPARSGMFGSRPDPRTAMRSTGDAASGAKRNVHSSQHGEETVVK